MICFRRHPENGGRFFDFPRRVRLLPPPLWREGIQRGSALLSSIGICLTLLLGSILLPHPADAAVNRLGSWSKIENANLTFTPAAGNKRVILIAVTGETSNQAADVSSVTYGGQIVTPINTAVRGAGYSNVAWMGYCNEVCIENAVGSSIAVSTNANNDYVVAAATFENVDQILPIYGHNANTSGANTITASLNTALGARVVYVVNFNGNLTTSTPSSGFTNVIRHDAGNGAIASSHTMVVDERTATTAATPLSISTSTTTASNRTAIVAVSLREYTCAATAPSNLTAVAPHGGKVDLSWTFDRNNNDYYKIYRNGTLIGTSTIGKYTDTSVAVSTAYNYVVQGFNNSAGCESTPSNTANVTTGACAPTTGPITINGGMLSGRTVDLSTLLTTNGASLSNYRVSALLAPGLDELESFSGGGPKGWSSKWTTDNRYDPPGNRDLMTDVYTRSADTGPGSAPDGAFLYYEASAETDTVRYLTHVGTFDAGKNELSVSFNYNMNGADIGSLALEISQNGGAWTSVWSLSGDQGDTWTAQTVNLELLGYDSGNIGVRFKFTYGTGYRGDIAIDEVKISGPGRAGTVYFDGNAAAAAAAQTDGAPAWPDATDLRLDITGTDNCGTVLTDVGTFLFRVDNTAPTVTVFNLPASAVSPISVYSLAASDNVGVTGYMVTESATPPAANDPGWENSPPTLIRTNNTGAVTFYAWAKDAANNVSAAVNRTVTVGADGTAPVVTAFIMPDAEFSPIPVVTFSAMDDSGVVAGYMVTESATPPAAGAAGWQTAPPTDVVSTGGAKTFYAWAKDEAGNVSAAATRAVTVKVDTNAPTVTFDLPDTADSLTVNVGVFSATDTNPDAASNMGVTGYMITRSGAEADPTDPADPRWLGAPPLSVTAPAAGSVTFKAWAKDAAGNISNAVSDTVVITLPASCDYDIAATGTYIEAEDFVAMTAANPWSWNLVTTPLADSGGYTSSGGYLNTTVGGTGTAPNGARVDYPVNFPTPGTYYIWIRALDGAGTSGGDSAFWGIDGTTVGAITQTADNRWAWTNGVQTGANSVTVSTAGPHTIHLWPRETGQKIDAFFLTTDSGVPPQIGGQNVFTGNNDITTTVAQLAARGVKMTVDPTCVDSGGGGGPGGGGTSNYINIPDGQEINGNPISPESLYQTDLGSVRQYRALGMESDGFNGFSLNSKWIKTDIGGDTTSPATVINEQLNLLGSGTDIGGTSDMFSYLYQGGKTGDFTIDVKVASVQNTNNSAKAGIMVRQSLSNNSPHATIAVTPGSGVTFLRRTLSGGTTTATTATGQTAPKWLRLKRSGNTFYGYYSGDGISWVLVGSATVNMTGTVNVGLGVTSRTSSQDCLARFDNFLFMPAGVSGMSETWNNTSTASPASIATTGWTNGDYALNVRATGVEPETNTFTFSSCVDGSPSTLSVHSGQKVSGSSVSLNALIGHTGNVGSFRYNINGVDVLNPWNSYSVVPSGNANSVTLNVQGTDPECGGKTLSANGIITVDNLCIDSDPSTITIRTGQSVGGGSADLTKLFTSTGDVAGAGLTYKINNVVIGNPAAWDSRSYGTTVPEAVTLEITGIDPDCGNTVTAINRIEVDNACSFSPPSITFNRDVFYVGPGRAIPYLVTVRNEDSLNCGSSTLTVTLVGDNNSTDFNASYLPSPSVSTDPRFTVAGDKKSATITLAGREAAVIELAVSAKAGATEWNSNEASVKVASDSGEETKIVTTTVFLVSPITHNSVTTASPKWGGNWGTSKTGSKYGNFTCLTCHDKAGGNIKWLHDAVATPDGSTWGTSGQTSLPQILDDARSGAADWGNDDWDAGDGYDPAPAGVGRTGSNRACEVCHSTTMYHRYDTEADPDGAGPLAKQTVYSHFPNRNCIDCHRHSLGFTADCTGCHGNPPLDNTIGGPTGLADIPGVTGSITSGTHYKHVIVLNYDCEYCHAGWRGIGEMPKDVSGKQQINHKFNIFEKVADLSVVPPDGTEARKIYDVATAGHYTGQDGVNYEVNADQVAAGNQLPDGTIPPGKGTLTCENIYCHGGTDTMGGTNPQWNGNITCNACHGTSATNTPPGYSHTTHVGKMGQACTVCHGNGVNSPLPGSNGHVNGSVSWDLTAAPHTSAGAVRYKGSTVGQSGKFAPSALYDGYGTCTNVACHYGVETPVWNSGPATCTTCHSHAGGSELKHSAPDTGDHMAHVHPTPASLDEKMIDAFVNKCESCHGGGANTGTHPGHLGAGQGTGLVNPSDYVDFGGMTYDKSKKTCTSLCHDGSIPDMWGSHQPLSCEACHMAPYLGPTVVDPDNEGTGMASSGFGSHLKATKGEALSSATNWTTQCTKCHPYHTGGVTVPEPTTSWDYPWTTGVTETENMAQKLGLMFPVTGGIHLGGSATSGSTEADICWNCHGTDSEINEWGYNADSNGTTWPQTKIAPHTTTPGSGHTYWENTDYDGVTTGDADDRGSFNFGYLYTSNHASGTYSAGTATTKWVAGDGWGNWHRDGYQHDSLSTPAYRLSRRITSVHSVNFDSAGQVSSVATSISSGNVVPAAQETPANIRCSYCHDVHDLNKAVANTVTGATETATGRPYLRGNWMGNPYAPDVPPLSSYEASYNTTANDNHYTSNGKVFPSGYDTPRLFSHSNASKLKGGYFIDANSGRPTTDPAYDSLEETAGLCTMCHGADVNNMDFYPNSGSYNGYNNTTMWRTDQVNGHANSALGGEGAGHANARNLFNATRGQTYRVMAHQSGVAMGLEWGKNTLQGAGSVFQSGGMYQAFKISNPTLRVTGWYGGTPGDDPSSKPTEYATWYSTTGIGTDGSGSGLAHSFTCSKCHSPHATSLPALLTTNCLDRTVSSWAVGSANPGISQALNCHRKDGATSGWHKLNTAQ